MKRLIGLTLVGIGTLSLLGCGGQMDNGQVRSEMEQATAEGQETVLLDSALPVLLDVRNGVGDITLRSGADDAVTVVYTLTAYADTTANAQREVAQMRVIVTQEDGRVQVNAVQPPPANPSRTNRVDLVITVPRMIDLVLRSAVGDIDVRGLRTPERLDVSTAVGDITLREIEAGPRTIVAGDAGNVTFAGALADSGSASLTTEVGKIDVRLPQGTAAELDARTVVGGISLRGLNTSRRSLSKTIPGATLTATLGEGGPALKLSANVGDISLNTQ